MCNYEGDFSSQFGNISYHQKYQRVIVTDEVYIQEDDYRNVLFVYEFLFSFYNYEVITSDHMNIKQEI